MSEGRSKDKEALLETQSGYYVILFSRLYRRKIVYGTGCTSEAELIDVFRALCLKPISNSPMAPMHRYTRADPHIYPCTQSILLILQFMHYDIAGGTGRR